MNYKKIHLLSFIFILYFTLIIYGNTLYSNNQSKINDKQDIVSLISSAPDFTSWNCTWGTIGDDICYTATMDSLDNIYLVGTSTKNTNKNIAVIKYNSSGEKQWENLISETIPWNGKITLDLEKNIYVTYISGDFIYLKKYDAITGSKLWNYTLHIGKPPIPDDVYVGDHFFNHLLITDTYNCTYLAWSQEFLNYDFLEWIGKFDLVKFNSTSGKQLWNYSKSGDVAYYERIAVDPLNNIYLCGDIMYPPWEKFEGTINLIKYDSLGIQQWNRSIILEGLQMGGIMALDSLNNLYITGYTIENWISERVDNIFLIKFNKSGQIQWYKEWGGNFSYYWPYNAIAIDSSDNIYVTESMYNRMFLTKYDMFGKNLWNYTWMGGYSGGVKSILIDSDDNVYICGESDYYINSENDIILFKFDNSGNLNSIRLWGGEGNEEFNSMLLDSSGGIYITGTTTSYGAGSKDMFLLKNPTRIISEDRKSNVIPSYDLFHLTCIVFICLISLSKKQLKSYKKRKSII